MWIPPKKIRQIERSKFRSKSYFWVFWCFIWSHTWTEDDFDEEMDEDVFSRKQVDGEAGCLKVYIMGVSESKGDTRLVLVSADIPQT